MRFAVAMVAVAVWAACPPSGSNLPDGGVPGGPDASTADRALSATVGTSVGGEALWGGANPGITLLVALRDATGAGAPEEWNGSFRDEGGAELWTFKYTAGSPYRFDTQPFVAGPAGQRFSLHMTSAAYPVELILDLQVPNDAPLDPPLLSYDAANDQVTWAPDGRVATYSCDLNNWYGNSAINYLSQKNRQTSCDNSVLGIDVYSAVVTAYSAQLSSVAADHSMLPALPTVHVSHATLAFAIGTAAPVRAVGGIVSFGGSAPPASAVHFAITAQFAEDWWFLHNAPGERETSRFYRFVDTTHVLEWLYFNDLRPGRHSFAGSSYSGLAINAVFDVNNAALLPLPTGIAAVHRPNGKVDLSWNAVPGAASYYAAVAFHNDDSVFRNGLWVTGPSASFPASWFTSGKMYDFYVTAADVNMTAGVPPQPAQVAVSDSRDSPKVVLTYP